MANKNIDPNLVALRTRAAELGVLTSGAFKGVTQVKHIDTKALRTWVKNEEARLVAEAEMRRADEEAKAYEQREAQSHELLAQAETAARRSAAGHKGAKTRVERRNRATADLVVAARQGSVFADALLRADARRRAA